MRGGRAGEDGRQRDEAGRPQRKLDSVEQLGKLADDAGLTLIEMAIAFVLRHPAITAAIIGPRAGAPAALSS